MILIVVYELLALSGFITSSMLLLYLIHRIEQGESSERTQKIVSWIIGKDWIILAVIGSIILLSMIYMGITHL